MSDQTPKWSSAEALWEEINGDTPHRQIEKIAAFLTGYSSTLTARCEALEQEKTLELETAKIEHTRAILRYTFKGYTAGENADSKHWRERAEAAESRCASLTRVLAQLRDEAMVMDVAYPIIASVLSGEEKERR